MDKSKWPSGHIRQGPVLGHTRKEGSIGKLLCVLGVHEMLGWALPTSDQSIVVSNVFQLNLRRETA